MSLLLAVQGGGAVAYTLTAQAGTYSIAGGDAVLSLGYSLSAQAGAYALTGGDAALTVGYSLTGNPGAYTLTGGNTQFSVGRALNAQAGTYSLTGGDAALTVGRLQGGGLLLLLIGTGAAGPVVEEVRRPKATGARLQYMREGKQWLVGSRTGTKGRPLRAEGFTVAPVAVTTSGQSALLGSNHATRVRRLQLQAAAVSGVLQSVADAQVNAVISAAAAGVTAFGTLADTTAGHVTAGGAGAAVLRTSQTSTTCERLRARGIRNLSDYELAAVAVAIDTRR